MAKAFNRKYKLTLGRSGANGTVVIQDLHIEFNVGQTANSEPNTLELKIFNLADETISKLDKKDLIISLEVGYEGAPLGLIFRGTKTFTTTYRNGPDIITVIHAGEGVKEIREARCNDTLPKGITLKQALEKVIEQAWPTYGKNLKGDILEKKVFNGGYSPVGNPCQAMEDLTKPYGLQWNILNSNQINVFPINGTMRAQSEYVLLSPDTGLIDFPEKTVKDSDKMDGDEQNTTTFGIRLTSLINHKLLAGNAVKLQGTGVKADGTKKKISLDGTYKIERVTHHGSYEGGDWITEIEVVALK